MNNTTQIDEFCKEKGFVGWFETSAKENINIDDAARFLVTQVDCDGTESAIKTNMFWQKATYKTITFISNNKDLSTNLS